MLFCVNFTFLHFANVNLNASFLTMHLDMKEYVLVGGRHKHFKHCNASYKYEKYNNAALILKPLIVLGIISQELETKIVIKLNACLVHKDDGPHHVSNSTSARAYHRCAGSHSLASQCHHCHECSTDAFIDASSLFPDVDELRRKHRIVGSLIGCLPRIVRQNAHLGLPLKLMREEVTLLLDKGICRLVKYDRLTGEPSPQEVEMFNKLREDRHWQQNMLFREERRQKIIQMADTIMEGKCKKLAKLKTSLSKKGKPQTETQESVVNSSIEDNVCTAAIELPNIDKDDVIRAELEKLDCLVTPKDSTHVQLFNECPWLSRKDAEPVEWHFPFTDTDKLRYHVFKDIWEKGYYLSSGGKFGGDFLVYPGDPMRYHASYIAVCVGYHQPFTGLDVICKGRLGTNVKKTVLMCSMNEDNVEYLSLNWTGLK